MSFTKLKLIKIKLIHLQENSGTILDELFCGKEFHISREARLRYQFDDALFGITGNVIFANFHATRIFAQQMNNKRDVINFPEKSVKAGQINAMGLIDEILHYVVVLYRRQKKSVIMTDALKHLEKEMGKKSVDRLLLKFVEEFPPLSVYKGEVTAEQYLKRKDSDESNRETALEELMLLWLANVNPAFAPFLELFDDTILEKETVYLEVIESLQKFFEKQPSFGPDNENLIDMLRGPSIAVPHSLSGQLEYIRKKWGLLLGDFLYRILGSLDLIKEEEKITFLGAGNSSIYEFRALEGEEVERFSPDKDWMPRTVLLAKSTYVWMEQLAKKYKREISRLDQIPDEELDQLARWGFTGLWLIGLWQRSNASQRIKQLCGNPEAVASAYSLFDYQIADDLGGEEAYQNLRKRAWDRGIRMAGDMVPNHMGIDSRWVMEHSDRFISLDYCPYPSYTFNGPNLSWQDGIGIFLEDHYYSRSDAAVVFKRVDFGSGETRFIYHGNDGTSMPWNDTAQLNYLKPEVREGVIQTILDVARRFPIIRFDAAMTVTKKHYQRLWFPEPGSGGDIPTRAEHGMPRSQFDQLMNKEFWREVVDRVAQEVPDTLLLAEAFWLMEGYFVRTLGMHRVYNSAFMNMLKNEENAKYRSSIKNVLEFNPEILKRFVNFMNNPDEETAVAQFGKEDKYFGVCIMMITMPGLPMFGHGQIEGFQEKYGMEYRRSYWNEQPDIEMVRRHEREIFPILRKRHLFADVQNFYLYDFFTPDGQVNENVFCYSNRYGEERGLVIYNNKYENTAGWIKTSVAYSVKSGKDNDRRLEQINLGDGLYLSNHDRCYVIFRDSVSGLEFIRKNKDIFEHGLFVELGAFKYNVFLDFREIEDNIYNHYTNLHTYLSSRGVPNIEEALRETFLRPVHQRFEKLVNPEMFKKILTICKDYDEITHESEIIKEIEGKINHLLLELKKFTSGSGNEKEICRRIVKNLDSALKLTSREREINQLKIRSMKPVIEMLNKYKPADALQWYTLIGWIFISKLGAIVDSESNAEVSRSGIDEWLLGKIFGNSLRSLGYSEDDIYRSVLLLKILTRYQIWWESEVPAEQIADDLVQKWLRDQDGQKWLQLNRYRETLWYNKESFQLLGGWFFLLEVLNITTSETEMDEKRSNKLKKRYQVIKHILDAGEKSSYQVYKLLEALKNKKR